MKAALNRDGFDRNPHDFKGGSYNWYHETKQGLEIYSVGHDGRLGIIPWRSIEASLRRKQAAKQRKKGQRP